MTWNLWWRFGPWEERQRAILATLGELRPDVIGLQEVWAVGGRNLAGWLADELGMHWTWAASELPGPWRRRLPDSEPDRAVDVGNAVLSRWPLLDRAVLRLPAPVKRDDGRAALYALLDAPGGPVPFFTTHLNSDVPASALRVQQVRAIAEFIAERRAASSFPPVLTGDFNAWPDSDEMRLLGGVRTAAPVPGQILLDAWEYADPAQPSATWDAANPYVARTFSPTVRIDYIHVGHPGPRGLGHVRSVRRVGHGPVDGVWPSDHAGVLAELAGGEG
ncbi:endonuclease/exonuclease/phosphatase family protein [Streptomyces sp. LHD-70]|uniref:endonuclease/exonuclease/phosphatase family protein n=1 Tax=Streptomyces sp. LHD-70 TaxID=3072140 RepID=UPI00280C8E4B|nr:endonuclease/exonuclease/phosphatase family protein [Streptomyces sp. LHD-70]MDQ8702010.1 endonuclease/exonuclease/phosphatase family protein [Streptomyces sp. LHD-70]